MMIAVGALLLVAGFIGMWASLAWLYCELHGKSRLPNDSNMIIWGEVMKADDEWPSIVYWVHGSRYQIPLSKGVNVGRPVPIAIDLANPSTAEPIIIRRSLILPSLAIGSSLICTVAAVLFLIRA